MMLLAVLAVGLTGCVAEDVCDYGTGTCVDPKNYDRWAAAPKATVSPETATLAVGKTQTFIIGGARTPLYMRVVGCLGDVVVCHPTDLSSTTQAFPPSFRVERQTVSGSTVTVTFLDAGFRPRDVTLEVRGSDGFGNARRDATLAVVPLLLSY